MSTLPPPPSTPEEPTPASEADQDAALPSPEPGLPAAETSQADAPAPPAGAALPPTTALPPATHLPAATSLPTHAPVLPGAPSGAPVPAGAPVPPGAPVDMSVPPFTASPPAGFSAGAAVPPVPPPPPHPGAGYPFPGSYPPPQYYAPVPPMNTLAIVALIGSFFVSLVGIICGHIALSQIKRTGERGRGLALAGLIIGYGSVALGFLLIAFIILLAALGAQSVNSSYTEYQNAKSGDCQTVTAAGESLSAALTAEDGSFFSSPPDAKAALDSATEDFEASTSDISDFVLSTRVDILLNDLSTLSKNLDALAESGDEDTSRIDDNLDDISRSIDEIVDYCS